MERLHFGTDGWRAVIADGFTYRNVARCAQAYAEHLLEQGSDTAVVGYDTRFSGAHFARTAAEVLAANGLQALLAASPLPTPALSFAVRHYGAGGGIMISASHNPAQYQGFKIKGPYGGSATEEIYGDVAARVNAASSRAAPARAASAGAVSSFDVRPAYYQALARAVDVELLSGLRGTLVHDAMGGAAAGWLAGFVGFLDLPLEVEELRGTPDPMFHGVNPEPVPANLAPAVRRAAAGDPLFVAATDGDGDRLGVVLPGGRYFNSHQIFTVLLDLMQGRGGSGRVVKTFTVSRLVERLAQRRGLSVVETPVGFKHIVAEMQLGGVLLGGEESGGFAVEAHLPERDGILSSLLLLEALARRQLPLAEIFVELEREAQWRHAYDRLDLHLELAGKEAVMAALEQPPERLCGRPLVSVERRDGVKLNLGDDCWLLFRTSGTEPLLRVYAEAPTDEEVSGLLAAARALVDAQQS